MAFSFQSLERNIWEVFLALLMLCAGMALVVIVYMWLAWYASLHAIRERSRNNNHDEKSTKDGLSKSDIQKLPTVVCSHQEENLGVNEDGDDHVNGKKKRSSDEFYISEDLECTVCLEQFKDGDKCLLMPSCKHCFHVDCADAWLSKHSLCPLCRTSAHPNQEHQQQQEGPNNNDNTVPDSAVIDIPS